MASDINPILLPVLYMDNINTWVALAISAGVALLVALLVQFILVPMQRRKIMGQPVHFNFGDSDGMYAGQVKWRTNRVTRLPHPIITHSHALESRDLATTFSTIP